MKVKGIAILVVCGIVAILGLNLNGQESGAKKVPETFQVKFETTVGDFVIEAHREWAKNGTDRFYELVTAGFYDDCKFFRVIPGFMVQFGISGDPKVSEKWSRSTIKDDPVMKSNKRGFVTFAKGGPNSRTTQIFINFDHNKRLDSMGFAPFGEVIEGMDVVDKINSEYKNAPQEAFLQIESNGNDFLKSKFPRLDGIEKAAIIEKEK